MDRFPSKPFDRFRMRMRAEVHGMVRAAVISFLVGALLIPASAAGFWAVTGSPPSSGDTWSLLVAIGLVGGMLAYHAVGALMILLFRARLLNMLLDLVPTRDQLVGLLAQGNAPAGRTGPLLAMVVLLLLSGLVRLPRRGGEQPPHLM